MSSGPNQTASRRDFFRSAARYGGLVTLGAAFLWLERSRNRQTCVNNSICAGCAAFTDCGLPAALSAKAAAVSPISKSAGLVDQRSVGLENHHTADSEIFAPNGGSRHE